MGGWGYPTLKIKLRNMGADIARGACTPIPGDSIYMTDKITLFVRDHTKSFGNFAGCVPRKQGCVDDGRVWDPKQISEVDKGYRDRFLQPLPAPLTANGLKEAMLAVFKYRNKLYSSSLPREGIKFSACAMPEIEVVKYAQFEATKITSPYQKKIQVDIQRTMISERDFYLVTFYVYELTDRNSSEIKVSTWSTPWLVMDSVKSEEIMYELLSNMSVGTSLFNVNLGEYPAYFK